MTVKELRDKLSGMDGNSNVVVHLEEGANHQFFEIDDVSLQTGRPSRDASGKPGFKFDRSGPVTWLFISITGA